MVVQNYIRKLKPRQLATFRRFLRLNHKKGDYMAKNSYEVYARMRDARGVSDYAVCMATGVAPSTVSAWKSGDYTPKLDKLKKIADYFGVSVEVFI